MVQTHAGLRLVGRVSHDATAIEAPEQPAPKPPSPPKRLDLQPTRTLQENLADLPAVCNVGTKRNSKGHQESWISYKLHLDTLEGDLVTNAVLTSGSVDDSRVAIPLAQMTAQRVRSLYDLMESTYDAP